MVPVPAVSKRAASDLPPDIQPGRVTRSPAGYRVNLQQSYEGTPVYGGRAIVHMSKERSVYFYSSDPYTADRFITRDPTQPGPHEQLIRDVFGKRGMTA